jgi:hypothetical protein
MVQENYKNAIKKYFKIISRKFKSWGNIDAATPHFSVAKPNRNQAQGLFYGRVQCVHGPQCS